MNQLESSAQLFKTLSEPVRLRVLNLLIHAEQEICVCDLMQILEIPQSVVSRHLAYLRKADLVNSRREGVWIHYSVNAQLDQLPQAVLLLLKESAESNSVLKADIAKLGTSCCL